MRPRADGLRLALTTFTVLPVRGPTVLDAATGRAAMLLAPLVGVALGVVVALPVVGIRYALGDNGHEFLPAVLAITMIALLTRALHLDGLADTTDGLASYRSREEALAVMRSGDVGAVGVAALVLTLLVQVSALELAIAAHHGTVTLVVALASGRLAATVACARGVPVAAGSRLGALVVGTVPRTAATVAVLATVGVCGLAGSLDFHTGDPRFEVAQATLAPLLALAVTWALRRHVVRRLGGVNGDVLGAHIEVATAVVMVWMAVGSNPFAG